MEFVVVFGAEDEREEEEDQVGDEREDVHIDQPRRTRAGEYAACRCQGVGGHPEFDSVRGGASLFIEGRSHD